MSLEQFDDFFKPQVNFQKASLQALPDGDYELEVLKAEIATTPKTGEAIVRWNFRTAPGGIGSFEHVNFLRGQDQANLLGADMKVLGFPTEEWDATHPSGKRFSIELPKALAALSSVWISVSKTSKTVGEKTYHNLKIKGRTAVADMPTEPMPF